MNIKKTHLVFWLSAITLSLSPFLNAVGAAHHAVTAHHTSHISPSPEKRTEKSAASDEKTTEFTHTEKSVTTTKTEKSSEKATATAHSQKIKPVKPAKESLTHATQSAIPTPIKPTKKMMEQSVRSLFDSQHTDSLTSEQVKKLVTDGQYTGHNAALVAALAIQVNDVLSNGKMDVNKLRFSKDKLLEKLDQKDSDFYIAYTTALNKINQTLSLPADQRLWGPNGISEKDHIIQGNANDCYFLSAVNSLLHTKDGAQKIQHMITAVPGQPNQFTVTFPGAPPIPVTLTHAELGMYSHVLKGGEWLAILSTAEAYQRDKRENLTPSSTIEPGYQTQTMHLLTARKYSLQRLSKITPAQTETLIKQALAHNLPIGIETTDHDLSVIGYNEKTQEVAIKNPWGTTGPYTPNKITYTMKNGVFYVPLDQLSESFVDLAYHIPGSNEEKTQPTTGQNTQQN